MASEGLFSFPEQIESLPATIAGPIEPLNLKLEGSGTGITDERQLTRVKGLHKGGIDASCQQDNAEFRRD